MTTPDAPGSPDSIELTCQEVVELVTEYLSHAMPAGDRARLEQHLLTCPPCTAYLAQVRATVALTGGLADASTLGDPPAELVDVFRRWTRR